MSRIPLFYTDLLIDLFFRDKQKPAYLVMILIRYSDITTDLQFVLQIAPPI